MQNIKAALRGLRVQLAPLQKGARVTISQQFLMLETDFTLIVDDNQPLTLNNMPHRNIADIRDGDTFDDGTQVKHVYRIGDAFYLLTSHHVNEFTDINLTTTGGADNDFPMDDNVVDLTTTWNSKSSADGDAPEEMDFSQDLH